MLGGGQKILQAKEGGDCTLEEPEETGAQGASSEAANA